MSVVEPRPHARTAVLRTLVTGGAGFIGSHLVRRLRCDGCAVRVFDNLSTGRLENLDGLDIEVVHGDLRVVDDVRKAVQGIDAVFHMAALPSVPRSWNDPVTTLAVNAHGTANVVEAACAAAAKMVIYSSSSSVYGDQGGGMKSEDVLPAPISPYGYSKLLGEKIALAYSTRVRVLALRYFNVFGPRQDPNSPYAAVIPIFMDHALANTTATVNGSGDHRRDFTYVDNVVEANVRAMRSSAEGTAVNVACGQSWSITELIDVISRISRRPLKVRHGPPREGDIKHSLADLTLANQLFGYSPVVTFEEGLRLTYEAYKSS